MQNSINFLAFLLNHRFISIPTTIFLTNCIFVILSSIYFQEIVQQCTQYQKFHTVFVTVPMHSCIHRVIILNRGSMFAFRWREFSPPLSSAHRLLQCYHKQKRDRRRCNSRGIPPQPPATKAISQWARSLEWRHAVTLHILVRKICITFFLFYCEGMLPLFSIMTMWQVY